MEKFLIKILNRPLGIFLSVLAVTAISFYPIKKNARMETDLNKYMPESNPAFVYSNKAEEWFGIKDGIIIALENKKKVFNTKTLETVKKLTKELQKMPEINKEDVTSLYTADNIVGTEEGMDVKRFFKKVPKSEQGLLEIKNKVESNEMIFGRLVSKDETVTTIIAEIGDHVFSQKFYREILALGQKYQTKEIHVYVAGRPIVEGTMALLGPVDMKKMVPIVLFVIALVLFITLRSVKNTLITLSVVFFSTIITFGFMTVFNIPIYAISTMMPVMLIAIGVADGIHMYNHLGIYRYSHPESTKKEAVVNMVKSMWKPVVMTSVTTAAGFISLLTSQVYPIKYFGIFTAFGVLMAMVLSLLLIPSAIMLFGLPKRKKVIENTEKEIKHNLAYDFAAGVMKHKNVSIILTIVVVGLSLIGMQKIWINSSFLEKFSKNSDIVRTDKFINEHFGGTTTLNLILDANGKKDTFKQPEVLKLIDSMQNNVEKSLPVVGNSFSLSDYIDRMNKVMNADSEQYNCIPNSQNMIAQYLLLYEMSGDPENLNKVTDYNYSKANVTFQLKSDNSKAINSAIASIEQFKEPFQKLGVTMKYAGSGYKAKVFTDLILEGQIWSLLMSLLIVIILLALMFKSFKIGLIGSVPIIITALISFGLMGFLNIPLNSTTALLSSIAIGIGIDYAVHFIEQYRINSALYTDKLKIAQETMVHSGRAILFNAVVVIAGFMVLLFSSFPPNRELGALVSLNMFTSFVGTLTIMLVLLDKTGMKVKRQKIKVKSVK